MPGGPRYTKKQKEVFLKALASTGKVTTSCKPAGVSLGGIYEHRRRNAAFRKQWEETLNNRLTGDIEAAEEALWQRGVKGVDEPVFHNGKICGHKKKYSDTALIRYLQAKKPEEYKESHKLEHSGELTTKGELIILPPLDPVEDEDEDSTEE